jgi:hypothetical protein
MAGRPGWRFPIDARLAGKTFVSVRLDVVARAEEIEGGVEQLTFPSMLAFAGFAPSLTIPGIWIDPGQMMDDLENRYPAAGQAEPVPAQRPEDHTSTGAWQRSKQVAD